MVIPTLQTLTPRLHDRFDRRPSYHSRVYRARGVDVVVCTAEALRISVSSGGRGAARTCWRGRLDGVFSDTVKVDGDRDRRRRIWLLVVWGQIGGGGWGRMASCAEGCYGGLRVRCLAGAVGGLFYWFIRCLLLRQYLFGVLVRFLIYMGILCS